MNRVRKLLCLSLSAMSLLTIASCNNNAGSITDSAEKESKDEKKNTEGDTSTTISTVPDKEKESESVPAKEEKKDIFNNISINDVYKTQDSSKCPTTGDVKVLVLPVEFTDQKFDSNFKETLNNALTGSPDKTSPNYTGYSESLQSFYKKSSYGKLNLSFEIGDIYSVGKTSKDWYQSTESTMEYDGEIESDSATNMVKKAYDNYARNHTIDSSFDKDGDGRVDATILVYSVDDYSKSNTVAQFDEEGYYWAYVYSTTSFGEMDWNRPNIEKPTPCNYMWLSYDFMWDRTDRSNNGKPKTDYHTIVHEFGHMLGLDDYYGQEDLENPYEPKFDPMGGVVMEDYNICDHDAFSKTLFGWTNYHYVTDTTEITIKPLESSGDTIIIPTSKSNGTMWDEYIMIELYSPTGLNELDSKVAYGDTLGLSKSGIKVYHIDNRLYAIKNDMSQEGYADLAKDGILDDYTYVTAASNCQKLDFVDPSFSLCHMIQAGGVNTFVGETATNKDLFQTGSKFSFDSFKSFFPKKTMNNGASFDFEIEFVSVSSTEAKVKIIKK